MNPDKESPASRETPSSDPKPGHDQGRADEYAGLRERMVRQQLEARGITDSAVLTVFRAVPRHCFVEPALEASSYGDHALPIGSGQTISQPYMVALMTELLAPRPEHRILEIGTGSGYQTAILSRIVHTVFTIERVPELAQRAQRTLADLGIPNVVFRTGDGTLGWSSSGPYDGILVAAAAPEPPRRLLQQLKPGGRLLVPTGVREHQVLRVIRKWEDETSEVEDSVPCAFVPLIGREGWDE